MSRVSHMESCLLCGSTGSGAVEDNPVFEVFIDKFIELAVRAGDHKALKDLALNHLNEMGCFSTTGCGSLGGPATLYKLRRARIAQRAMAAMVESLEPSASDEHHFDSNGHLQ